MHASSVVSMFLDIEHFDGVGPWLSENNDIISAFRRLESDFVIDSSHHLLLNGDNGTKIGVVLLLEHLSGSGLSGFINFVLSEIWEITMLDKGVSSRSGENYKGKCEDKKELH